jgi:hypothetical protein
MTSRTLAPSRRAHRAALALTTLLAAAAVCAPASAATYSAVGDFSTASPVGVWSYGTGVTGSSFIPMTTFSSTCEGAGGLSCWQTPTPVDRVPLVLKNFSGSTQDVYNTVVQPTDVLNVHPGPSSDAIVSFTAPTTSSYHVKGFFEVLDVNPNGVNVIWGAGGQPLATSLLSGQAASFPNTVGSKIAFDQVVSLKSGDTYLFGVNNAGSYYNDSTGLSATISAVPEPAAWAMMLVGVAAMGSALRTRRSRMAAGLQSA